MSRLDVLVRKKILTWNEIFFSCQDFIYLVLERGEGREKGRETSMCGCLSCGPYWGPGLQPRRVPWLGIEPATLWFAALTQSTELHQPGQIFKCRIKVSWTLVCQLRNHKKEQEKEISITWLVRGWGNGKENGDIIMLIIKISYDFPLKEHFIIYLLRLFIFMI